MKWAAVSFKIDVSEGHLQFLTFSSAALSGPQTVLVCGFEVPVEDTLHLTLPGLLPLRQKVTPAAGEAKRKCHWACFLLCDL